MIPQLKHLAVIFQRLIIIIFVGCQWLLCPFLSFVITRVEHAKYPSKVVSIYFHIVSCVLIQGGVGYSRNTFLGSFISEHKEG